MSAKEAFSSFGWLDAVDILLLTALLFFLFRFLISRKSASILIGVAVYFLFYVAASLIGLCATSSVLSGVFRYGLLVILILFQPELRELFERVGTGSINGVFSIGDSKKKEKLYYNAIDNICAAVNSLSVDATGALIVISRSVNLADIVESGIPINADVNAYLIRNLFYNKAPLHDGAVVITNARIEAAGCLLPLSRRTDVDSDLGTRHRAAIGMSEVSDAIVIVVSEETGSISVAKGGALTENVSEEALRTYLEELVDKQEEGKMIKLFERKKEQ